MKKQLSNNILLLILIIVLAYGIMQLAFQNRRLSEMIDFEKIPAIGDKAFMFKTKDLNGNVVELKNKTTLLIFFDIDCDICEKNVQKWKDFAASLSLKSTQAIGISVNSSNELHKFIKKYQLPFPIIYDQEKEIFNHYKVKYVPLYVIVDKTGKIAYYRKPNESPETALQKAKRILDNSI